MTAITALQPDDFASWEPLWQGYLAFYKASVPEATTALTFARLTGQSDPMGGFLARNDLGAAIGMVNWIDHRSCWTPGDYCYLQDLFVAPDGRAQGAGKAMIHAVVEAAKARGCSRVYWLTHETNTDAMVLYDRVAEKSGFLQYRVMW